MHENANHQFVGELRNNDTPEKFTRVVVHGRVYSHAHDEWFVVITDMIPAPENGRIESYYYGDTRLVATTEYLTWGNEAIKLKYLPIVNHEGVRQEFPGWVSTGIKGEHGKIHMLYYRFADVRKWVGCGREAESSGGVDAGWFMGQKNSCRDCQKQLMEILETL